MWQLSLSSLSVDITASPTLGAPIAAVQTGSAPLVRLDAEAESDGDLFVEHVLAPDPVEVEVPSSTGDGSTVTVPAIVLGDVNATDVTSVQQSGYAGATAGWSASPAIEFNADGSFEYDPQIANIEGGTFAFNPATQQLFLFLDWDTATGDPIVPSWYSKTSLQVSGKSAPPPPVGTGTLQIPSPRSTNRLANGIPRLFYKFPMQGEFSISLGFEQAPSGAFSFNVPASYRRNIECELEPGQALEIFNIWFRIESLRIQEKPLREYPAGAVVVSVSLGGYYRSEELSLPVPLVGVSPRFLEGLKERIEKILYDIKVLEHKLEQVDDNNDWQRKRLIDQINVLKRQVIALQNRNNPELLKDHLEDFNEALEEGNIDPECVLGNSERGAENDEVRKNYVELTRIARKAGICYNGPSVKIRVPENASRLDCTSFQQHVTEAARLRGKYLDYHGKCIKAKSWSSSRIRSYPEDRILGDFSTSINAQNLNARQLSYRDYNPRDPDLTSAFPIVPSQPDANKVFVSERQRCIPYGAKYCRTKLTGRFAEEEEDKDDEETKPKAKDLGKPRWRIVPPVRVTLWSGDVNATASPSVFRNTREGLPDLSLLGQFEKTLNMVMLEDGVPVFEVNRKYGFTGTLESGITWGVVERTSTFYRYDEETGYLLGYDRRGFRMVQLLSESPGSDTQDTRYLSSGSVYDSKWSRILNWQPCPISGGQRFIVATFSLFYGNIEPPPLVEYKQCLSSGRSVTRYKPDPNYVEPAFAEQEGQRSSGIVSFPHPDTVRSAPLPPYSSGERTLKRTQIEIDPAVYGLITNDRVGWVGYQDSPRYQGGEYKFEEPIKPDTYTTYTKEETAQGPEFKDFARNSRFQDSEGRPSQHTRKPLKYVREEPPDPSSEPPERTKEDPDRDYNYYLSSPGCLNTDCDQGSKSYQYAETLGQAMRAATTELEIDDFNNALSSSCEVPFDSRLRPGDIVKVRFNGTIYYRRIKGIKMSLSLKGWLDGKPFVTWEPMSLDLGIHRFGGINVTLRREKDYRDALRGLGDGISPTIPPEADRNKVEDNDKFRLGWLGSYG